MRSRNTNRRAWLAGAAAAALLSGTAAAQTTAAPAFEIAAGDLGPALSAYAKQAGVEIFYQSRTVAGRRTGGLHGRYEPREGLDQLIAGTDLVVAMDEGGALVVREVAADPQSASAGGDVDALIVTAQKREENIQDVPIAISAFTQEELTNRQVAGGADLMTQVPNMTFTKTNFSSYSIQIRGIGTQAISATTDPAVAVAFNNTPFVRNRFFEQEFYDLQRVEVLRGPQGTLYGRNATAGVVNIISAKPSFRFEAKLSADVANYNSARVEGMVNIPLVEDAAALRIAGAWTKREGFVTNEITGNPIDGRDLWSTRVSLRIEPSEAISANLIWEHFEEDDDRLRSGKQLCKKHVVTEIAGVPLPEDGSLIGGSASIYGQGCVPASMYADESFQTPNGFTLPYFYPAGQLGGFAEVPGPDPYLNGVQSRDLRVIESTVDPKYIAKTDLVELQLEFRPTDALTLASETSYSTDRLFSTQDFNRFNTRPGVFVDHLDAAGGERDDVLIGGVFCDPQIGCADRLVAMDLSTAKSTQFSQELRLSSDFEGAFNFSLGGNFLRYDTEDKYYVFINTLSMVAAGADNGSTQAESMPPYVMGVSDNHECLPRRFLPGNPFKVQSVTRCIYTDPNPIGSLNDLGHNYFLSKNPYKLISYALFGETYYQITPDLKITGGLRWTVDRKEAPRIPSWLLAANSVGYPVMEVVEQEWSEPTGRLTIDWKPQLSFTDETLVYASYAHGYKAGGANPPPTAVIVYTDFEGSDDVILDRSATSPKTFEAEYVDAFEIGAKNTLLDGRLTLNLTAFYYDYEGYQISQIVDRSASNMNFDAEVWGAELEMDWRPLENLRLGFKGGYENTRVADGMKAIDIMDRTAGRTDWVVARPFPTVPSNCILPVWLVTFGNRINVSNEASFPPAGPCMWAWTLGRDPITEREYEPFPDPSTIENSFRVDWTGYPGFNPAGYPEANNGQGFFKDLSGKELPNAPHFTATLTADWTLPLPDEWLMTLHTDFYYQSEAWTRIFNMEGYDKLKAYTNVNFAAIFTNEDAGWRVMAYVKNVLDRDSITGAFLNSDDTSLTTNVFLTEPRLYGVRVSKQWTGGSVLGGFGERRDPGQVYPFVVELGGMVQRHDAPNTVYRPDFMDDFSPVIDPSATQEEDLDWGDGRGARLTYAPAGRPWKISAVARFGKTNAAHKPLLMEDGPTGCIVFPAFCPWDPVAYPGILLDNAGYITPTNYSRTTLYEREDHLLVDFLVGREIGLGATGGALSAGLRYARFNSKSRQEMTGIPDWQIPPAYVLYQNVQHHLDEIELQAERRFTGVGPMVSWEAAQRLLGADGAHLDLDWSLTGGVLFGKHRTVVHAEERSSYYDQKYSVPLPRTATSVAAPPPIDRQESKSVAVPTVGASLGFSYTIDRLKVGAGYRWERYFDAIDGGIGERKEYDRTIDGPYFKVSVGFGG